MQDMKHRLNPSILERRRAHLQWQQQQQQEGSSNLCDESRFFSLQSEGLLLGDGWPNHLILSSTPQYDNDNNVTREKEAASVSTAVNAAATAISNPTSSAQAGKLDKTPKKRKAGIKTPVMMVIGSSDEGERREKRMREDSGNDTKGNAEDGKQDYIHVRARRGQATDSHSLAERVRRERIGERMKYLQGLVPGCNKITGKAGMLDEIINYVQSLQRQVEFLSMKLASVNPVMDINMESLFNEEIDMPCISSISSVGMPSEQLVVDPAFIRFNSLIDMATNPTEPLILDSCFNVQKNNNPNVNWDTELHNLYGVELHQGRASSAFPFHSLQGNFLSNGLKREL